MTDVQTMTYEEAEAWLFDIPRFTKKNDAQHTEAFLRLLGDPQEGLKIIHVAGTNGKGSVCAYLDGMLRSEGKRTGLFTSPHLIRANERIAVDGVPVDDTEFLAVFETVRQAAQRMEEEGLSHPTFFEFLFGMALCAFARAKVEYAVIETGLGGRLDATNSVKRPVACVITSIGIDHMQYLGDTLEKIAGEKAGIIKPGVPVFYAQTSPESDAVIENTASEKHSFCKKIGKDAYEIIGIEDKHIAFSCSSDYYGNTTWKLNNIGVCQPGNAMLAMEVMRFLFGENGHPDRWRETLFQLKWAGRMEEILPDIYIDGAHNPGAMETFVRSIPADGKKNISVFSAMEDKEYEKMAACLIAGVPAQMYVVTHVGGRRGVPAETLGSLFRKYTERPVAVTESADEALDYVMNRKEGCRVFFVGSLYLAGRVRELIQEVR